MTELIEGILSEAWQKGATDVHLAVGTYPFMRVSGQLEKFGYERITNDVTLDFLLLNMSESVRMMFEERGEYSFSMEVRGIGRVRVTAHRGQEGVSLAFRLQKKYEELSAECFTMPETVWKLCEREKGLILVTGPAGSGKTTTLAALIKRMSEERALHIVTLERPIEYMHFHKTALVNQRELGYDSDAARSIENAVRADADVLVLSELRDAAVTEAALAAAEAGVLVFVELNAGSAMGALEQLIDNFELNRQKRIRERLLNALEAIVFQELTPDAEGKLCVVYKVVESKNSNKK